MDLIEAVRELRKRLGITQPTLAARLGLSARAIANYEKDRRPRGNPLRLLAQVAEEAGFADLATRFREELAQELGTWDTGDLKLRLEPQTSTEKLWVSAVLAVLRNAQYAPLIPKLAKLLREPAEQSIKVLESHKKQMKLTKQALALLEQGRSPEEIADALFVPLVDVRNLASIRELRIALQQANQWATSARERLPHPLLTAPKVGDLKLTVPKPLKPPSQGKR